MRRFARLVSLCLPALLVPGAAGAAGADEPAPLRVGWEYTVRVDAALERLDVRLCCRGYRPRTLRLADPSATPFLTVAPAAPGRWGLAGPAGDTYSLLEAGGRDLTASCVEYAVDLRALVATEGGSAERVGRDLTTDPRAWLLAPTLWPDGVEAALGFALPAGVDVTAPWREVAPGARRLGPGALLGESCVAFGRFVSWKLAFAGSHWEVAVLDAPRRASDAGLRRWVEAAGNAVAALYGARFPREQVQILTHPVRPGGEPVVFGRTNLYGGAGVELFLSGGAADADLPGEWVAIHELVHAAMPNIQRVDSWFSEGFVTYYQEVLRARAGHETPREMWQALHEGFGRGRRGGTSRSLADESREMLRHHAFQRVYWGGAALALRLDLALRAASGGHRSLDDAMRLLAGAQFQGTSAWTALDLVRAMDAAFGGTLAMTTVRGPLASSDFPRLDDLYAALGLDVVEGQVVLRPDAPRRADRDAISRPPP